MTTYIAAITISVAVAASTVSGDSKRFQEPRIYAAPDASLLVCYMVVHDLHENSGYVCIDGRVSNPLPPAGDKFFPSVADLRSAILEGGFWRATIIPNWEGATPKGWKIRDLTEGELKALRTTPSN